MMMNQMQLQQPPQFALNQQVMPSTMIQGKSFPTLYVGNLEQTITEEMLYKFFQQYGNIYSIRIMRDRNLKTSRGFAFISFYQQKDADNAKTYANHQKIMNNEIRVTLKKYIKDIKPDANVIVKNLDESVTGSILEEQFSQFGSIFSCIVCYDTNGKSRGYGYIQYDHVDSAQKAIQGSQNLKIKEKVVQVLPFQKKTERTDQRKNLYFKNLPSVTTHTKEQVKELLDKACSAYGEIESSCVELNQNSQKYFAFASFKEKESAEKCMNGLKDSAIFKSDSNPDLLYVEWHESKVTRQKNLKQFYSNAKNETNLYTKDLKSTVTQDQLKKVFEAYGVITSLVVKKPDANTAYAKKFPEKYQNTQFGYINFSDKDSAKKAIQEAKENPDVQSLYESSKVYLTLLIKRDEFKTFNEARFRYKKQPQFYPFPFDPFFLNQLMWQQFNPMMMGKQMNGAIRPQFQGQPFMGMPMNPQQQFQGAVQQQGAQNRYTGQKHGNQQQRGYNTHQVKSGKQVQSRGKPTHQRQAAGGQRQQNQQKTGQTQVQASQAQFKYTQQNLKENVSQFLTLDKERQRSILGELLYPNVLKFAKQADLAPKITGMLIDFEVFEVQEIIEFLESEENLKERVVEAEELIQQGNEQN